MRRSRSSGQVILLSVVVMGCGSPAGTEGSAVEEELSAATRPVRIAAGARLIVYGVTDDDFALYQDGDSIYATELRPAAQRRLVAQVGATQPMVFVAGPVAFIWTDQFYFGNGGVSPLVVWTAAHGPKLAAAASVAFNTAGTRGVAVRPDGDEIIFVGNVSPDGSVGDILSATPDLRHVTTLAAGVDVNFVGACPPLVGYDGKARPERGAAAQGADRRGAARRIVAACPAGSAAATNLPLPPTWSSDQRGDRFFTIIGAAQTPVTISAGGALTVLEDVRAGGGFVNFDGSILLRAGPAADGEIQRFAGTAGRPEIIAATGNSSFVTGHQAEGFRSYLDIPTSRDAALLLYADTFDPSTGLKNLFLVDVTAAPPAPLTLQAEPLTGNAFDLFTADSTHALYYKLDPTTFNPTLFAASLAGDDRQVSSGNPTEFVHFALTGALVAYSDNLVGTGIDLFDHHDVFVADVAAATIAPRLLAPDAYNLFFATGDRRAIVYTSDHDPSASGLFVVRAR